MALLLKLNSSVRRSVFTSLRAMSNGKGEWGSGAGKGGGSGGSIRDAGGAFGKQEAAREEEFFRRQQKEQLEMLRGALQEEIDRHESLIKQHEEAIKSSKAKIQELAEKTNK